MSMTMNGSNQNQPYQQGQPMPPVQPAGPQQGPPMAPPVVNPPRTYPVAPAAMVPVRHTKNKFLTVLCAFIPGAGQMYQGLMKKGISLMLLFTGIIAAAVIFYMGALCALLPVVWFYAFFDALNRINLTVDELKLVEDKFLFVGDITTRLPKTDGYLAQIVRKRHVIIGWVVILLAIWLLLNVTVSGSYSLAYILPGEVARWIRTIIRTLPTMVLPLICLFVGIRLVKGSSKKSDAAREVYDEYTIPQDNTQNKTE